MKKLIAIGAAAIAVLGAYVIWAWYHPLETEEQTFMLAPGMSVQQAARLLHARGLAPDAWTLPLLARLRGDTRMLKVGEYRIVPGMSLARLLDDMIAGKVVHYPLTLIEGWNFRQVRAALAAAPKLRHTLQGQTDAQVMARLGHPDVHPEGWFFPDTYNYSANSADVDILRLAYERMQQHLAQAWAQRRPDLPLATPYDALILASIVEKETGRANERALIAGVFINRLRQHMRLQTDPTVIYGLGASFDGNLRRRDLLADTPYNTYTRRGLPPTPIAMPSGAALMAAVQPAETDALYFVARGDGSHVFSETLTEHNAAVQKFQLGR